MGRRNTVMIPKSEHPLLNGSEWLREYDQVFAANLFRLCGKPEVFQKNHKRRET